MTFFFIDFMKDKTRALVGKTLVVVMLFHCYEFAYANDIENENENENENEPLSFK